jgi:hypothetical protein
LLKHFRAFNAYSWSIYLFVHRNRWFNLVFVFTSPKGQLDNFEMSFWCFQFIHNMNLKTLIFALAYWGRIFGSFLEELKPPKSLFESNWPLPTIKNKWKGNINQLILGLWLRNSTSVSTLIKTGTMAHLNTSGDT